MEALVVFEESFTYYS